MQNVLLCRPLSFSLFLCCRNSFSIKKEKLTQITSIFIVTYHRGIFKQVFPYFTFISKSKQRCIPTNAHTHFTEQPFARSANLLLFYKPIKTAGLRQCTILPPHRCSR